MKKIAELAINEEYQLSGGLEELFSILNSDELINFYCKKCKSSMTFKQIHGKYLFINNIIGNMNFYKYYSINYKDNKIMYKESEQYNLEEKVIEYSINDKYYFIHSFVCPQANCHNNIIQIYLFLDNKIKKYFKIMRINLLILNI